MKKRDGLGFWLKLKKWWSKWVFNSGKKDEWARKQILQLARLGGKLII